MVSIIKNSLIPGGFERLEKSLLFQHSKELIFLGGLEYPEKRLLEELM